MAGRLANAAEAGAVPHLHVIKAAAQVIVFGTGLFLLGLGLVLLLRPQAGTNFLMAFASTPAKHYAEIVTRLAIGIAFIAAAPSMWAPLAHLTFGWVLAVTTVVLALVPWRVHQRFSTRFVPSATSHPVLLGVASAIAGIAVLTSAWHGAG